MEHVDLAGLNVFDWISPTGLAPACAVLQEDAPRGSLSEAITDARVGTACAAIYRCEAGVLPIGLLHGAKWLSESRRVRPGTAQVVDHTHEPPGWGRTMGVRRARGVVHLGVCDQLHFAVEPCAKRSAPSTQQPAELRRRISVIVALLLLVLATLLAGPLGFIVVGLLLLAWSIVTGTLHLVIDLLLLPFRAIGAMARDRG